MRGVWQTPGQFFSVYFCVWLNLVLIFYDFVAGTILRLPMKKSNWFAVPVSMEMACKQSDPDMIILVITWCCSLHQVVFVMFFNK